MTSTVIHGPLHTCSFERLVSELKISIFSRKANFYFFGVAQGLLIGLKIYGSSPPRMKSVSKKTAMWYCLNAMGMVCVVIED
jgi:hypothetical protein